MPDPVPLSGDVEGMASSHPGASSSETPTTTMKLPQGPLPHSNPPQPAAPQPAPQRAPASDTAPVDLDAMEKQLTPAPAAPQDPAAPGADLDALEQQLTPPAPNRPAMDAVVKTNLQAHAASLPEPKPGDPPRAADNGNFFHDVLAGLGIGAQSSISGLVYNQKAPTTILPEHADMAMRIGSQVAQFAGDLPAMLGGLVVGGAAGTVEAPVVGTVGLGAAGAFAAPPAIRKLLMDHFEGKQGNTKDFVASLMASTWEGVKGGLTGLAMGGAGKLVANATLGTGVAEAVAKGIASPLTESTIATKTAELAAMTTIGSALEGHLPKMEDVTDGAIMMLGLHGLSHVTGIGTSPAEKIRNEYAATGKTPAEQVAELKSGDPEKLQQVLAGNAHEPPEAAPMKMVQRSEMVDTRGGGQQFHGANNPIDEVTPGHWNYNDRNIYGQGLYTTDAADVARGYAGNKPGTSPTIYSTKETAPANLLDLEKPMPNDIRSYLESFGKSEFPGSRGDLIDAALKEDPKNLREFYDEIRAESSQHGYTTHDVQEAVFMPLQDKLQALGYDGIQHEGGRATGTNAHQVKIYFTPEKNLSLSPVDPETFRKPPEMQPKTLEDMGTPTTSAPPVPEEAGAADRLPPKNPPPTDLGSLSDDAKAVQSVLGRLGENGEAPGKTWKQSLADWYTKSVDYVEEIKDNEKLAKSRGADINPENSAENKFKDARGYVTKAVSFMQNGTEDAQGNINGESLDKIFKDMHDAGLNNDEFRAVAMARDALGDTEHESGINKDDAARVVKALQPKYQEYLDRVQGFRNKVLDWAADKGRYSEAQVEEWKDQDTYSPRMRAFEASTFGEEQGPGSRGIKERVGSTRDILDPIAQTQINTARMVKDVLTNEARSSFVDNMKAGALVDLDGKYADTAVPPVLKLVSEPGAPRDNQIAVYDDGERKVYEGSQMTIDVMKRLDGNATGMDLTSKILRGFTNMVRVGVVSNPLFGMAHFIRGQIMAGVNSTTGLIPFVHPAMALAEMMGDSDGFRKFVSEGGGQGGYLKPEDGYLSTDLAKEDNAKAPFYGRAWNAITKPFQASEAFIRLTDTATKFSEYNRSLEQGAGPAEARANARMVTPDYANTGLNRSVLRTGVAFIGAHINSLDNMAKVIDRDPVGAMAKLSVISGMSAALWYVNHDDEDYKAIPDWQKNTYWNIKVGGQGPTADFVKIPKPWAPGILFGSGVENALDAYFNYRPSELPHFAQNLMKSVVPEVVPNILQPVLDQYSNKQSFTGRPLVPFYKQQLLPEMQYTPYTSETAKALGKLIGYVPLVKDIGPSSDTLASPAVVENYVKSWGGTMGSWALHLSDKAISAVKGGPDKAENWEDSPFVRQFVSRFPSFSDQRVEDFYENREQADKAYNSQRAAAKAGDFDAMKRIQAAHPDFSVRLDGIAKGMTAARKVFENIQEDPNLPPPQKRQQLDSVLFQIGSMAKMGNQMMSDFKAGPVQTTAKGQQ